MTEIIITGPVNISELPLVFANVIALGFGLSFMVYSTSYLASIFRKIVDDSLKK